MASHKIFFITLMALSSFYSYFSFAAESYEKEVFRTGWYLWDPYQYEMKEGELSVLTGLDVELVRELASLLDVNVKYEPVSWRQHQKDIKTGARDFAAGATYTDERAQFVYFSIPYRFEENALFVRRGDENRLSFENIEEFLNDVEKNSFKLGVIDGFIYASPAVNAWLSDERNQHLISYSENDHENIRKLENEEIDGFLADRLTGATTIWRENKGAFINEIRLGIKAPIHLMFSKKTISKATVEKFNEGIRRLRETKKYNQIISWYLHPVLLLQTVDSLWFSIIELIGTIAFAISGLAVAYRDRATIFGAIVFAMLPSLGGGVMRDVVFDRSPVRALEHPLYLMVVLSTVFIGYILIKLSERLHFKILFFKPGGENWTSHVLAVSDGLGLAAFTISGIVMSVMAKAVPLWLWGPFFALITGVGGGVLRDLLSKHGDVVALRGKIYPEIAVIWGLGLSIFLTYQSDTVETDSIWWSVMITVCGIFLTVVTTHFLKIPNIYFKNHEETKS